MPDQSDDIIERLQASEEMFSRTFLGNPAAMSLTNAATERFTVINESFTWLLGYTRAAIIGRTSVELGLWPDPTLREMVGRQLAEAGATAWMPGIARAADGTPRNVVTAFRLLRLSGSGDLILSVLVPVE